MEANINVAVDSKSYPVFINAGSWLELARWIETHLQASAIILASDQHVAALYLPAVEAAMRGQFAKVITMSCTAGETAKSVTQASRWWDTLGNAAVDRRAVVVALGGGVVGDLAGFVAATHLRGLRLVQVPTTLLAQVDSSVGGKVGINLAAGKNLVGCFWQPQAVWIDTTVLQTLSQREFAAGMAEVIKYAMIADANFFQWLEHNRDAVVGRQAAALSHLIGLCCQIKADIVRQDPLETLGVRAFLNFGHTIGHAIEQQLGYGSILHGEAVSIGMLAETRLAIRRGGCAAIVAEKLRDLLLAYDLPVEIPETDRSALLRAMQRDKKNEAAQIVFVLPREIGRVQIEKQIAAEDIFD